MAQDKGIRKDEEAELEINCRNQFWPFLYFINGNCIVCILAYFLFDVVFVKGICKVVYTCKSFTPAV